MKVKRTVFVACLLFINIFISFNSWADFKTISGRNWDQHAVRKVLHTFAYGGFASDDQIMIWAKMRPAAAIKEMITFDPVNPLLSPPEDTSSLHSGTLESLQNFWGSSSNPDNPVPANIQRLYRLLTTWADGTTTTLSANNLQRTWINAATTRGINPVRHKVGLYLTNYHMAISIRKTKAALMRSFYDNALTSLDGGASMFDILAEGASSAAVARAYRHQNNTYRNDYGIFRGNDDFAREYHQLFFKIMGEGEDPGYHENTTIEHTAWMLTGMDLDLIPGTYGASKGSDAEYFVAPIIFTDHQDGWIFDNGSPRTLNNFSLHYEGCLEVLHNNICGATAEEKIYALAQIAGYTDESLRNLPVAIIDYFADDNLGAQKIDTIESAWLSTEPKSLLAFLRSYAISKEFHNENTVKYRTTFNRNLTIANLNTLNNQEALALAGKYSLPISVQMANEGAVPFEPAHDVFGGQTGVQAANNPSIFKNAYSRNVNNPEFLGATSASYESNDGSPQVWTKNWGAVVPNQNGTYTVGSVAEWLWRRFTGDGGKNYDRIAQAQLHAILATGTDFGYVVDPLNPDISYSSADMEQTALRDLDNTHKQSLLALGSADPGERDIANHRVGLAVNFITATPYLFALEGK